MCVEILFIFIGLLSSIIFLIVLFKSIYNTNKYLCNKFIFIDLICFISCFICNIFSYIYDISFITTMLVEFCFITNLIIFISTLIINSIKKKKLKFGNEEHKKKRLLMYLVIILVPIIMISIFSVIDYFKINKGNIIVIFESDGKTGISDFNTFGYTINNDKCKEFDLGVELISEEKYVSKFIKNKYEKVNYEDNTIIVNEDKYKFEFKKNKTLVYKNEEILCTINNHRDYLDGTYINGYTIER